MRTGRPKATLIVTDDERQQLESLAHRSRTASFVGAARAHHPGVRRGADQHGRRPARCGSRRRPWASGGGGSSRPAVDGLLDEPRPGTPRRITDEQVEAVIVKTLESTPRGATHWSTRGMAKATGLSAMAISRIWRAFGLQPHRTETFKLSPDPLLIDKVRDIVGPLHGAARARAGALRR